MDSPAVDTHKMKQETIEVLKTTFKNAVRAAVAKSGGLRWGEAESLSVIEALVEEYVSNEDAQTEGFDAIRANVSRVVNPSAFAQFLEKLPTTGFNEEGEPEKGGTYPHPARITRPKRGSGGARGSVEV